MVSYEEVKKNKAINTYIQKADESLRALGYTEHSFAHVVNVAHTAEYILKTMGYDEHDIEIVKISAYLHDIGNLVNRVDHSQSGAVMAFRLLTNMDMEAEDIAAVTTAIGNHDEGNGVPVNAVAAALILADKSDVRRSRVRNTDISTFDITISDDKKNITLRLAIDTEYGSVMDYFEIFLGRMILCRKAAERLGLQFKLIINDQPLI